MDPEELHRRIVSYLYGELGDEQRAELEELLTRDEPLAEEVRRMRRLTGRLDGLPAPRADVDVVRIVIRAGADADASRRRWRTAAMAVAAAGLVVAALVVWSSSTRRQADDAPLAGGTPPARTSPGNQPVSLGNGDLQARLNDQDTQLRALTEILHRTTIRTEQRDRESDRALLALARALAGRIRSLEQDVAELRTSSARHVSTVGRDVAALYYLAQNKD